LPVSSFGNDNFEDFIRLSNGSFVLAFNNSPGDAIGTTELWHISATGAQLGTSELLNPAGTGSGGIHLTQLADGRVMAGYSGITTATGTDLEIFREVFTVAGPSTTPTNSADSITGTSGEDVINGLDGNDTILGLDGNDTLTGGAGNDSIVGGAGNDVIYFGFGDTVSGGDGDDIMILSGPYTTDMSWGGGAGYDIFDASGAGIGLNTAGGTGLTFVSTERGIGSAFEDYFRVIDQAGLITGKQFDGNGGNDRLEGGNQNDTLNGGAAIDVLIGNAGVDVLDGGIGDDYMAGGADGDFYYANDTGDIIIEVAGEGYDYAYASSSFTYWANVEYVIATGSFDLVGIGNEDANAFDATLRSSGVFFSGRGGNDVLYGSNYSDTLYGGDGNDILLCFYSVGGVDMVIGGNGDDVYYLYEEGDVIIEDAGAGSGYDTYYTQASVTLGTNVEQAVIYGVATAVTGNSSNNNLFGNNSSFALTLDGAAGDDWLIGSSLNDTMLGGANNDVLQGLSGTNLMSGGTGDDQYFSTAAADVITENFGEGRDTLYVDYNVTALAANVEQLYSYGGVTIGNGNTLDNTIYANNNTVSMSLDSGAGADLIFGSNFGDTIIGGAGNDILIGLGGADRFAYTTAGNMGADIIIDFIDGIDLIDLSGASGYSFGINMTVAAVGGDTLITFGGGGSLAGTTLTLAGINSANVSAADFVFV
jgi:Ca2+-binding RTX toxin-like protein